MRRALTICPSCGADSLQYDGIKKYSCSGCNWEFYQNTAAAVAGILEYEGKFLAVIRNIEPDKGKLDFPGGFVDPMESAEEALQREIMEELNVEVKDLNYLCSAPNIYNYKNIEYSTCDIFYHIIIQFKDFEIEKSEIAGTVWQTLDELNPKDFAFRSMKVGISALKKRLKQK